jgi:hypothetical protein
MSFSARLLADLVVAESGATTPLTLEVSNKGSATEHLELQIEGVDPEWTAIPVPTFEVTAGETSTEKVFFKPPRVSESVAGNYPFVLRVRSLESGEAKSLQGVLQIKPFNHVSMEISPKKGHVSPFRKLDFFSVTIINLGNTEHTLQFFGGDPEDACTFDFEHEQVTVGPGQQKTVEVDLGVNQGRLLSGTRLHGFTVSGRSIEAPAVVASAQGQLEQRPLMTVAGLFAMFFFMFVAGLWVYLIPKPPSIAISVDHQSALVGQPVEIRWKASNAYNAWIKINDKPIVLSGEPVGSKTYTPTEAGDITIEAYSTRENKESDHQHVTITVTELDEPQIVSFKGPKAARVGQPFRVQYELGKNVTEASIEPGDIKLDPQLTEAQITSSEAGNMKYTLIAKNVQAGAFRTSTKKIFVDVTDQSKAVIVFFTPSSAKVDPVFGKVTLNWEVKDAVSMTLSDGTDTKPVEPTTTSMEMPVSKTTTFTLTAYDDKGKSVTKTVKVVVATADPGSTATPVTPTPPPNATTPGQ